MKKVSSYLKKIPFNDKLLYVLFLIPFIVMFMNTWHIDNDSWFLFNHGRYVLENGIPYIEPFTMHEGLKFVMQQWLSSVLIYLPYKYFGNIGVFLLVMVINSLILFVLYKLCMLISDKNRVVSIIITVIINVLMIYGRFIASRPQIFTYLILFIFVYVIEKYLKSGNKKLLIILPLLSVLEINLHASTWWILIITFIPFLIEAFYCKIILKLGLPYNFSYLVLCFCATFFCGLINPYGVDALLYLFNSIDNTISLFVGEMRPSSVFSLFALIMFFFLIVSFIANMYDFKKNNVMKLSYIFLTIGFLIVGLHSHKGLVYFYSLGIYSLAYYFKKIRINNKKVNMNFKIIYSIILLLLSSVFIYYLYSDFKHVYYYEHYLKQPIDYLLENNNINDIRLLTDYNSGGYTEYRGIKSYIDPRAEVFLGRNNQKDDIFEEYYDYSKGTINIDEFINKYNFTHVLITDNDYLFYADYFNSNFNLIFEDDFFSVKIFERKLDI